MPLFAIAVLSHFALVYLIAAISVPMYHLTLAWLIDQPRRIHPALDGSEPWWPELLAPTAEQPLTVATVRLRRSAVNPGRGRAPQLHRGSQQGQRRPSLAARERLRRARATELILARG
jgi:hypothetical protein